MPYLRLGDEQLIIKRYTNKAFFYTLPTKAKFGNHECSVSPDGFMCTGLRPQTLKIRISWNIIILYYHRVGVSIVRCTSFGYPLLGSCTCLRYNNESFTIRTCCRYEGKNYEVLRKSLRAYRPRDVCESGQVLMNKKCGPYLARHFLRCYSDHLNETSRLYTS